MWPLPNAAPRALSQAVVTGRSRGATPRTRWMRSLSRAPSGRSPASGMGHLQVELQAALAPTRLGALPSRAPLGRSLVVATDLSPVDCLPLSTHQRQIKSLRPARSMEAAAAMPTTIWRSRSLAVSAAAAVGGATSSPQGRSRPQKMRQQLRRLPQTSPQSLHRSRRRRCSRRKWPSNLRRFSRKPGHPRRLRFCWPWCCLPRHRRQKSRSPRPLCRPPMRNWP